MKKDVKSIFPTIVFILTVAAVFAANSFISNKLYSIIPTYMEQPISHKNIRQIDINNDSFIYERLMFDTGDIKFSNPTEQEYRDILTDILESDWYAPLIKMTAKEMYWTMYWKIGNDKESFYKITNEMTGCIQIGTNEFGEDKYYLFQGYREDMGFLEGLLIAFSPEAGLEQFICLDNIEVSSKEYPEVELTNSLRQELADGAKKYVEFISDSGLIEHLPELYFPTDDITIEQNICYIQDSTTQLTVYYDTISDEFIGFRKNKHVP